MRLDRAVPVEREHTVNDCSQFTRFHGAVDLIQRRAQ
jgi:hypothetical protein